MFFIQNYLNYKKSCLPGCKQSETKRIRTAFTLEQLQILQTNFKIDPNPDGQDLGWIAQLAGNMIYREKSISRKFFFVKISMIYMRIDQMSKY